MSELKKIFRLKTIGGLTILKIITITFGLAFYMLQIQYFGLSREIEDFFVALGFTGMTLSLTMIGKVGQLLIPLYHQVEQAEGRTVANNSLCVIISWLLLFSIPCMLFLFVLAPFVVSLLVPGFSALDQDNIVLLYRCLVFSIVFQVLNIFFSNILNAKGIYGRTEATTAFRTVLAIAIIYWYHEELGIWALVISVWAEKLLNTIVSLIILYRADFKFKLILSTPKLDHWAFFRKVRTAYVFIGTGELYNIVLMASISFLPVGVFAVFKYVEGIFAKLRTLILSPGDTVFYTVFSENFAKNNQVNLGLISKAFHYNLLFSLLVSMLLVSFSEDFFTFLWAEKYNESNKLIANGFLFLHLVSLLFLSAGILFYRMAIVFDKIKSIYFGQAFLALFMAGYAFVAIRFYQAVGLGSVVVVYALLVNSFFFYLVYKHNTTIIKIFDYNLILRLIISSLITAGVGWHINGLVHLHFPAYDVRWNALLNLSLKSILLFILIIIQAMLFGIKLNTKTRVV